VEDRKTGGIGYVAGRWPLAPEKSTLILIHGAGGSNALWDSQVDALAERANTVAPDLPGHGASDGSGADDVRQYAQAVMRFIDEIDAPGPIPCGLSLGGAVTQQLLLDYPDRFRAGMLFCTGARLKVMPAIFETIENDFAAFVEMVGKFAISEKTDPRRIEPLMEATANCRPEVTHGDFRACNDFDVMARLVEIEVPVLVVTAEDDKLTPPKYGGFLETSIRNATRAHIMDAGHLCPLEKPEEVNTAVREFMDRTDL
jgi:pimeloyl-ACP methyl ester carboxylesterase